MATPGYIFGAGTGVATPEELVHRRRWAQAMIRSGTERTPQNPWEGLASIARAVSGSYTNFKADQEEEMGRAGADEAYRPIANALVSSSKPTGDQLNAALSNPWMSEGQKMIAQQLFRKPI